MPCFKPITAWKPLAGGAVEFSEKKDCREIAVPCGGCIGCRMEKVDAWGFRCMAEASLHRYNHFVTLTFSDECYPEDESLDHKHWQLFAKRLRKRLGPFRFFMCGEYGENTQRAHYHALLFGLDIPDLVKCNSLYSAVDLYQSDVLSEIWGQGFTTVGSVTHQSAKYVASYVMKRCSDELAAERYTWVTRFGEVVQRKQPYGCMSLKPGIGAGWLRKYYKDVVNHGAVYEHQFAKKVPAYFSQLIEKIDPKAADDLEVLLHEKALEFVDPEENTWQRLATKELCRNAAIRFKKERFPNAL